MKQVLYHNLSHDQSQHSDFIIRVYLLYNNQVKSKSMFYNWKILENFFFKFINNNNNNIKRLFLIKKNFI